MAQQEAIKIFKGNDTDFNDDKFITIKLTSNIDLSDFVGKFVLGSFTQTGALADGKMEIVIPRSYTSQFPLGNMCGTFALIDNKGRYATITNTILFNITNEVFTPTEEEIQLETPEDYPVEITVEVGFAGGNYEDLNNLPKINGVVVKGDKTGADYGLANVSDITTLEGKIDTHIANKNNPHEVSKAQVGLGNVDNTADLDKPLSTAVQNALNTKQEIIGDLETIRSGASAGATAVQPSTMQAALATKQDNLSSSQLDAVNSGIDSTKTAQITTNANNITDIESKIPSQATAQNQLADKDFVNSSIATNTANFIGTFNSVAELEAYSGTLTNNDYAFVIGTDSQGNTIYNRYKYTTATTPASWQFEYALNNSSFTAAQWAAINSGATSTNISQISANTDNISSLQSNKLDKTEAANTYLTQASASSTYATQTALQNGLAGKQDTLPAGTTGYYLQKTADGVAWAEVQGGGAIPTPALTWYTGNTGTTITIVDTTDADLVEVFKNGMLLQETEDYTISGTSLTLATALEATDKIAVKLNDMSSADLQAIEALLHNVNSGTN